MTFQQVYYTSSTIGVQGGAGFRVHAASAELDQATLELIEKLGVYVPPISAETRPSADELERFPLALRYSLLPGGAAAVVQSAYVGRDYSGRFGNFFAHSLVTRTPATDFGETLPVELWRSPTFCRTEGTQTTLPVLDAALPNEQINPERVREFLLEAGRIEHLPTFLTAVITALSSRRRIVMVDASDAVALWIAAAFYSLPTPHWRSCTFDTYAKNPYQVEALIVGTTADSDFGFTSQEIQHQYSVFDFQGSRFTQFPALAPFAVAVTDLWRAGAVDAVAGFAVFLDKSGAIPPFEQLPGALHAHALATGLPLSPDEIKGAGQWAIANLQQLGAVPLRALLNGLLSAGSDSPGAAIALQVYVAAQAATAADTREASDDVVVPWLLEAPVRKLEEALAVLPTRRAPLHELEALQQRWLQILRDGTQRPVRMGLSLRLGERLGLLHAGEVAMNIGAQLVAPMVDQKGIRAALKALPNSNATTSLLRGILQHLASEGSAPELLVALEELAATSPDLGARLEQQALERASPALYLRLLEARAASLPGKRVPLFFESLELLRGAGVDERRALKDTWSAIWPKGPPSVVEAEGIATKLTALQLIQAELGLILARVLIDQQPSRADKAWDRLCHRLADPAISDALGALGPLVQVRRVAIALRASEASASNVRQGLALVDSPKEPMVGFFDLCATRLAEIENAALHAELLQSALEGASAEFLLAYAHCVSKQLKPANSTAARHATTLFRAWAALQAHAEIKELQAVVLFPSLRKWRRRELTEVERTLAGQEAALAQFHAFKAAHLPQEAPGVLDKMKRWFKGDG